MKTVPKNLVYYVILSSFLITSCYKTESFKIKNLSKVQMFEIQPSHNNTVRASFEFRGRIDCQVLVHYRRSNSEVDNLLDTLNAGLIDTIYKMDWYNELLTIVVEGENCNVHSHLGLVVTLAHLP